MNIFKVYDPDDNALIYKSLTKLREDFDLSKEDTKRCFYPGVHHNVGFGITVITY